MPKQTPHCLSGTTILQGNILADKHTYETDKSLRDGVIIVRGGTVKMSYSKYKYDSNAENVGRK